MVANPTYHISKDINDDLIKNGFDGNGRFIDLKDIHEKLKDILIKYGYHAPILNYKNENEDHITVDMKLKCATVKVIKLQYTFSNRNQGFITLTWHRFDTGRYESVAYVNNDIKVKYDDIKYFIQSRLADYMGPHFSGANDTVMMFRRCGSMDIFAEINEKNSNEIYLSSQINKRGLGRKKFVIERGKDIKDCIMNTYVDDIIKQINGCIQEWEDPPSSELDEKWEYYNDGEKLEIMNMAGLRYTYPLNYVTSLLDNDERELLYRAIRLYDRDPRNHIDRSKSVVWSSPSSMNILIAIGVMVACYFAFKR